MLLKSENISNIDVFCALTNDDETNVMSSLLAKKMGAKKTMIILNNPSYLGLVPGFIELFGYFFRSFDILFYDLDFKIIF